MAEREVRFQVRNGLTRMDRADEPGTHIGVDQPRRDDVRANPVAALFTGEGSYGDFQGCFRHGVGRAVGRGVGDCGAGDRNDVAAGSLAKTGQQAANQMERPESVDAEQLVELRQRRVGDRVAAARRSRIAYQEIDRA
jgi:hypothetical protein